MWSVDFITKWRKNSNECAWTDVHKPIGIDEWISGFAFESELNHWVEISIGVKRIENRENTLFSIKKFAF